MSNEVCYRSLSSAVRKVVNGIRITEGLVRDQLCERVNSPEPNLNRDRPGAVTRYISVEAIVILFIAVMYHVEGTVPSIVVDAGSHTFKAVRLLQL